MNIAGLWRWYEEQERKRDPQVSPLENAKINEILLDPIDRERVNGICDAIGITRWRAGYLIRRYRTTLP